MGPIETIDSGHNDAVVNAENHRWGLRPIETCNSDANHVVLHAQNNRWGLGPIDTTILVLITLLSMHKTTDVGWDQ